MAERADLRLIVRALAAAALVPPAILLLRLPFHTPLFGTGLIRLLPSVALPTTPVIPAVLAQVLTTWLLCFAGLAVVALPVALALSRFGLTRFRYFVAAGLATGAVLAFWSNVTPYDPRLIEWMRYAGADLGLRTVMDDAVSFLQGVLLWIVIWRVAFAPESLGTRPQEESHRGCTAARMNTLRFYAAASFLSALWLPILLAMPSHREYIRTFHFPGGKMLFPVDTLILLCVAGVIVAWLFRRAIVGADRARSIVLGCLLPFAGTFVFLVLQMSYFSLLALFFTPGFEYRAVPLFVYYGMQLTFMQLPFVALVGIGMQFALRWAGRRTPRTADAIRRFH